MYRMSLIELQRTFGFSYMRSSCNIFHDKCLENIFFIVISRLAHGEKHNIYEISELQHSFRVQKSFIFDMRLPLSPWYSLFYQGSL